MRRPIRTQLLTAMLSVVAFAIASATAAGVYLAVLAAERLEEAQLADVRNIIAEANFPLTENVLAQMHGLSGAEFVLMDKNRREIRSTVKLDPADQKLLSSMQFPTRKVPTGQKQSGVQLSNTITLKQKPYRADVIPLRHKSGPDGAKSVLILFPKNRWWTMARQAGWPSLVSGLLAMLAGGVVAAILAGRLVRPIRAIENQTKAIADGRFDPVTVPSRDDEIADLAASINLMARRLGHYEKEVRASERMRALGRLGAGIAHQLRNSATGAKMAIELHRRECADAETSESVDVALRELQLMESYIARFLELGKSRPVECKPVDLCLVVSDVLKLVGPTCRHAGVETDVRSPLPVETIVVHGDGQSLRQLLVNLMLNAVEAVERSDADRTSGTASSPISKHAQIIVQLEKTADSAALSVMDSGPGPDEKIIGRLFEPFITGKPEGTGLGLYVARQIAESHHGSIAFSRQNEMTVFRVEIPLEIGHT